MTRTGTNMIFGMYTYIVIVTCLAITCVCLLEDLKCTTKLHMHTCSNKVPSTVPPDVTEVYITIDNYVVSFEDKMFADKSWGTVHVLEITAQYYQQKGNFHVSFQQGCFKSLSKLTELHFHGDRITLFSANTLASNTHLKLLDFSSCPGMNFTHFLNSTLSIDITIDNLTLSDISGTTSNKCKIDDQFIKMIEKFGVVNLNLSNSNILVQRISDLPERPNPVRRVDLSKVFISLVGKDTNFDSIYETYDKLSDGLISLNISELPLERVFPKANEYKARNITNCAQLNYKFIKFIFKIENVYADKIFTSNTVTIDNVFINISTCLVKLKTFQFRRNNVKRFNMTLYLPTKNNVTKVDISFNEITYLSPYAFNTATSLLTLNLDNNKLGQMENLPEFRKLLRGLASLKYFSIAGNGISNLPYDFFRDNSYLQVVDLSENIFETITFSVTSLNYLLVLNLSFNRIHFLEGKSLENVQIYFSRNDKNKVFLDFSGNPIECSCKSVNFIEWVLSDLQPNLKHRYMCDMEGEAIEISENSLRYSKYLCYRTAIFVAVSVFAVVLLSGFLLLKKYVSKRKNMRREKNAQKLFLKHFLKGNLQEQYLCQISFASEDEICILDTINPNLKRALNNHAAIERDCICLGDTHFNLGRPIVDEILRCISESCVMVYVISKYFCRSQWCEMELREAYEISKPIILILKGDVPENEMSNLLSTIFNRYTRAKLVIKDGQYELIPDWKSLCESIIKLAANSFVDKLNNQKRQNNTKQDDTTNV